MFLLGQNEQAPPGGDHNRERGPVQIIFTKKNIIPPPCPLVDQLGSTFTKSRKLLLS
jgi:hypothetical protein